MTQSEKQYGIRRTTRLPLEIPVLVSSVDPGVNFSATCQTTLVNAHGCGMISPAVIQIGTQVRIEMESAKRSTTVQVVAVVALGGDPETWLVGLEFDNPGNFWGIEYAPADWKLDECLEDKDSIGIAAEEKLPEIKPAISSPKWRLTDISVGACYLEAKSPFPVDTPVLVSIRVAGSEYLLEGLVRASFNGVGMGVEFAAREADHEHRIAHLIRDLLNHRDVPRILVGRQERPEAAAGLDVSAPSQEPDPLLQLVQLGSSLPAERFLGDLRAQRLGKRREPRIDISLPLLLSGSDVNGRPLDQRVTTLNVSRSGAALKGVHGALRKGDKVFLHRLGRKEEFGVAWIGAPDGPSADQIGVVSMGSGSSLWQDALRSTDQPSEVTI